MVEFNVRFGDPEATVLVATYDGDWFELLDASGRGDVSGIALRPARGAALAVVMAAEGYPGSPRTGDRIEGLGGPSPPAASCCTPGPRAERTAPSSPAAGACSPWARARSTLAQASAVAYGLRRPHTLARRAPPPRHRPPRSAPALATPAASRPEDLTMADIAPLTPLRYDLAGFPAALGNVVAPPYDVISAQRARRARRARSAQRRAPHPARGRGRREVRERRAHPRGWRDEGVLVRDRSPRSTATTRPSCRPGRPPARPHHAGAASSRSCASSRSPSASSCRTSARCRARRRTGCKLFRATRRT